MLAKQAAVGEAGERIVAREMGDLLMQLGKPDLALSRLEQFDDGAREVEQNARLPVAEIPMRTHVEHAKRADPRPVGRNERRSRVEAHMRGAGDDRSDGEARVGEGVGDDEHIVAPDRFVAKGHAARNFQHRDSIAGFDPVPLGVGEAQGA